ncbi:phage tail protein (plasmid) [Staphylococcus delphini]|uniref:phage tail spike protein n=1 Tax=Staphylococcus delphini TaxID=53344 RepID=UPI003364E43D
MFIRDLQGNEYPLFTDFEHADELNTNDSIRMQIPYDKNHGEFLSQTTDLEHWIIGDIIGINEYRIVYSKKITKGNSFYVDIIANPEVIERLDELRVYKRYDQYFTDVQFFNLVFANTPFTVMINGSSASLMWEGIGDGESKLSMFKRGIKRYGFEFKIIGNVVYLYDKIGNDTNYEFRYKLNAANIVKETDSQEFFTAIRGYGNYEQDEKDIDGKALLKDTYISPLASVYGEKWAPPLRDGRVKVAGTLQKEMKRIVDESLKISFSADIYDLSRQGYDYQHTVLGDRVFLVDERIKEDVEVRVVKKEVKYSAKKEIIDLKITFGTTSMTDAYKTSLQTTVKEFSEIMAGRKALPFAALDIVSRSMVSKIQNTSSELLFDDMGIHAIDKTNPNNIVTMNSSGWMLSTDGGRTAKTALTAEGIVADTITTGHLDTNLVTIRSSNSDNYIEMRNDFIMSRGRFTRTWANVTDTATLNLGIRKGHIMVSNEDTGYNLYLTEKGLSTMLEGAGDDTAGTLEFHSQRFNETSRGVTLHSTYGAVALLSENSRIYSRSRLTNNIESDEYGIYFRPYMKTRKGLNEFNLYVKEADSAGDTDGALLYGNLTDTNGKHGSGIRFSKSISENTIYATNQKGDIGTGDFYADKLFGDWKSKATNLYAMTAYDGELRVTDKNGYNNGNMTFRPIAAKSFNQVSSLKYKTNIENVDDIGLSTINNLTVVKYSLKSDVENGDDKTRQLGFIAEYSESIATSEKSAIDMYKLLSYNTKALQELHGKFIEQQKQIEQLEDKVYGTEQ